MEKKSHDEQRKDGRDAGDLCTFGDAAAEGGGARDDQRQADRQEQSRSAHKVQICERTREIDRARQRQQKSGAGCGNQQRARETQVQRQPVGKNGGERGCHDPECRQFRGDEALQKRTAGKEHEHRNSRQQRKEAARQAFAHGNQRGQIAERAQGR